MRLEVEAVALLGQAKAVERVLDAGGYRFEERRLGLVEALVVEPGHAHDAARGALAERSADESARRDREQVVALVAPRRLAGEVEESVIEEALRLVRRGARRTRRPAAFRRHR